MVFLNSCLPVLGLQNCLMAPCFQVTLLRVVAMICPSTLPSYMHGPAFGEPSVWICFKKATLQYSSWIENELQFYQQRSSNLVNSSEHGRRIGLGGHCQSPTFSQCLDAGGLEKPRRYKHPEARTTQYNLWFARTTCQYMSFQQFRYVWLILIVYLIWDEPPPGAADPLHSDASNAPELWSYVFEPLGQGANFEGAAEGNVTFAELFISPTQIPAMNLNTNITRL